LGEQKKHTERHRKTKKDTERHRKTQKDKERQRKTKKDTERHRKTQREKRRTRAKDLKTAVEWMGKIQVWCTSNNHSRCEQSRLQSLRQDASNNS
jgi:hypothetical protein